MEHQTLVSGYGTDLDEAYKLTSNFDILRHKLSGRLILSRQHWLVAFLFNTVSADLFPFFRRDHFFQQ